MRNRIEMLLALDIISNVSTGSRLKRLLYNPAGYLIGMLFSKFVYPIFKKSLHVKKKTFFGLDIFLALPSGLDIYLLGAKSHHSEIRLAKFLCCHLKEKAVFYDIGGHVGYFSLLAAQLVGENGKIIGFEASPATFYYYQKNVSQDQKILAIEKAVSDHNGQLTFYEYPNLYSEYNSIETTQYEDEKWASSVKSKEVTVESVSLDDYVTTHGDIPDMIKIDVEGAELKVIKGANNILKNHKPLVIMEFIPPKIQDWDNDAHYLAVQEMLNLGYEGFRILEDGQVEKTLLNVEWLSRIDSDNLVFIHPQK
ncbi:MAG: FkbM family methyltransferase [Saprospiraceae bacterium]